MKSHEDKELARDGYKVFDKVVILSGRLKGETGVILGITNLNMEYLIIVRRDNKRARIDSMGFRPREIELIANS